MKKLKKFRKQTKNSNRGFSLVELLLAVVLLAIVMVPLMQIILSSMSMNAKSRKQMAATDCAQTILEHLEATKYSDIQSLFQQSSVSIPFLIVDNSNTGYSGAGVSLGTVVESQVQNVSFTNFNSAPTDKRVYYSGAFDYYALSNVKYSDGYTFDVEVRLTLAPNNSTSDKYRIYTVTVNVYDVDSSSANPHSRDNILVSLKGSTFNSFEYYN